MTLDNRITNLEDAHGAPEPRPLFAMIAPGKPPDPPDRFRSEDALQAWCSEHDTPRPLVVVVPPKSHS